MSKKQTFILYNIDIPSLDRKYKINIKSNINDINCSVNKTNINELRYTNMKTYSYLDEAKKTKKCCVTLCDLIGNNLPSKTELSCYWCRHPFSTKPIGCPIKKNGDTYIVDGIYCSFNCILAFIESNNDYIYNDSYRLLSGMYNTLFETNMNTLLKAPSWKLLKEYGGSKTIEQFRDNFNKNEYDSINNYIDKFPKQLPIGWLYEEKISF